MVFSGIHFHDSVLNLKYNKSYNIQSGFGTCREWSKYKEDLFNIFSFKDEITKAGDKLWDELNLKNKETVSIHFRRTDYLIMSSLNLSVDYYLKAMHLFSEDSIFIVFSDDIGWVKQQDFFEGKNVIYMERNKPGVDMYLMSCCKSNIIANSTFSFWGAYLNRNNGKTVVCPHDFIGESGTDNLYLNGNWYPKEWIAI